LNGLKTLIQVPGYPVVLDTSVLMEGPYFTEFVWQTIHDQLKGELVRLIVPILVIEELDTLKAHRDGRKRDRARNTLRDLVALHGGKPTRPAALPKHSDVTIEVCLDDGWHQRMPNNDGEIIEQAANLRGLLGDRVLLAARDAAQVYRASAAGLPAVFIPPHVTNT
jgi:predicted ribonuclease YlaK